MTPRTVLYLSPSSRMLGARQSLFALVRHLDPARYRPIVCCQSEGGLTEALRKHGIEVALIKTGWWRKGRYWPLIPLALARLRGLVRRRNVDLIHCNEIYPNPFAVLIGQWTGKPVVTHVRFNVTPRMIRNYMLARADRIVCVSEAESHDFNVWPDKSGRVSVIHNAVDPEDMRSTRSREEIRRELGWPQDAFVVGQIATWAPRKRQHIAIQALHDLAASIPRLRLVLVGGAAEAQRDYESELHSLIAEWNLEGRVSMLPFTENVADLYHAMDLNILVSSDEVFGRTIIESACAGRPSIGTRIGGIPEIIRDGETGWLVPLDEPRALAQQIETLTADPETLVAAGEAARKDVLERFAIASHAARMQALYDSVLQGKEVRRRA